MFASINIRSASSLQAARTAGVMTLVIRTGVLRHLLEWGWTLVLGSPLAGLKEEDCALRCDTVQLICNL